VVVHAAGVAVCVRTPPVIDPIARYSSRIAIFVYPTFIRRPQNIVMTFDVEKTKMVWLLDSDGRFAKNENDSMRFDSVQPTSRYLINSLIFVKPVNDNVHVSISPVCL